METVTFLIYAIYKGEMERWRGCIDGGVARGWRSGDATGLHCIKYCMFGMGPRYFGVHGWV